MLFRYPCVSEMLMLYHFYIFLKNYCIWVFYFISFHLMLNGRSFLFLVSSVSLSHTYTLPAQLPHYQRYNKGSIHGCYCGYSYTYTHPAQLPHHQRYNQGSIPGCYCGYTYTYTHPVQLPRHQRSGNVTQQLICDGMLILHRREKNFSFP